MARNPVFRRSPAGPRRSRVRLWTSRFPFPVRDTFSGANGSAPDAAQWDTFLGAGGIADVQNGQLRLDSDASVRTRHTPDGTEILALVEAVNRDWMWLVARASGTGFAPTDCYLIEFGTTGLFLYRRVGGGGTFLNSAGPAFTNGDRRWVRLQVTGTGATVTIRFRQWAEGTSEPSTWNTDHADSDAGRITARGSAGFVAGNVGDYRIDQATISDAAIPGPRTRAQDALLQPPAGGGTVSRSRAQDAVLKATVARSRAQDAVLRATISRSRAQDAVLKATVARSRAQDAVLAVTVSRSRTQDGLLWPEGAPDAIVASTNLTGPVERIVDDPLSPDGLWLTAVDPASPTDLRVSFLTPAVAPGSGGPTRFRCWLRRVASAEPNPTVDLELWEAGTFRATLAAAVTITSTSGQLVTGDLNPASLTDASGAGIELRVRQVS